MNAHTSTSPQPPYGYFAHPVAKVSVEATAVSIALLTQIDWLRSVGLERWALLLLVAGLFMLLVNHVAWSSTWSSHITHAAFETMDILAHDQQWRRRECDLVATSTVMDVTCLATSTMLCKTHCGVWFQFQVDARAHHVVGVKLSPISEQAAKTILVTGQHSHKNHFGGLNHA